MNQPIFPLWPMKTVHMMINVCLSRSDALTQRHYQRFVTGATEVINSHSGWLPSDALQQIPAWGLARSPSAANNLSPSWRSTKQFEGHVKAETDKSLLFLARHRKTNSSVCWTNYSSQVVSFPNDEGSCDHQQCCVTRGLRVIRPP